MAKAGFTSKRNPWRAKEEEIAALKAEIAALRLRPQLLAFGEKVGTSIMTILAYQPHSKWPEVAKAAFNHERSQSPMIAQLWKDAHEKIMGEWK